MSSYRKEEEEEEVRSLLLRHRERIMLDLCETDLLAILVKNSVLTQSEEDLLLKIYSSSPASVASASASASSAPSSAPPSAGITKRKLCKAVSNSSSGSSSQNTVTTISGEGGGGGGVVIVGVGESTPATVTTAAAYSGCSANNSRSASVVGDEMLQSDDNDSIKTPSSASRVVTKDDNTCTTNKGQSEYNSTTTTNCDVDCLKDNLNLKLIANAVNDADLLREQSGNLIEIIAKGGFLKFKQFCYAIDNECPILIEDLFNDKVKCDSTINNTAPQEDKVQKDLEPIDNLEKEKENDRNRRAVSYAGTEPHHQQHTSSLPRAAPRRVSLMKEPPPPPPPKPAAVKNMVANAPMPQTPTKTTTTRAGTPTSKYPQSDFNLIHKTDSNSTLTASIQYQLPNVYVNASETMSISNSMISNNNNNSNSNIINSNSNSNNNYSSLLCHANSASSPLAVRKREKLLHRFSDAATLGRKLKKKKNTNRTCRSMTEAIEMLADPVIEDEFFGDRTTWEYHTVAVTRVPGYGFGIAVSGGRDNPHFANGDPSIAVSDVLKGGPAEERLQVNDRIITVNGVSLDNVEYATAVQVLRDSGNTVTLVVKRRVPISNATAPNHHHSHSMSSVGLNAPANTAVLAMQNAGGGGLTNTMSQSNSLNSSFGQSNAAAAQAQPIKVTLTKGSKKDDYGIVLGCRLFIKEISTKARDQLAANGYSLQEGDVITRIHNTNCGDTMSLKEAKKIIDGCKERLNLVVLRDITNQAVTAMTNQLNNSTTSTATPQSQSNLYVSHHHHQHAAQLGGGNCSSNNLDDPYLNGSANYSSQNLYVQPPTRAMMGGGASNGGGGGGGGPSLMNGGLNDEKSNLTPRGRSRGPIMDGVSLSQLDRPVTPPQNGGRARTEEPPRPPPPRGANGGTAATAEDFYSSRRQIYESEQAARQASSASSSSEPRFISFQKEGSVGIRLTGGNESGIFVTAVQPGSPASLQGLTPGDKILKVNDMDMHGVTREEAVLFLLSLQDRIDLIVQYCKEEYDEVVTNQRGDSFHIKTHFHCDNPSKGEMAFKAGDVFRVIDTLHNGVVGSWQVLKIGRGHQEMQRGVIPNKARAEELATAQFNANKKEMNSNESRGNFFRRRRSTHRRSKSLSRENWDDVVFADSISKFPAYERVVLRHPGFVRPLVLFGPISDMARERLAKDFPDKFAVPLQDDEKSSSSNSKCRIVRLSNIRDIMDRGKHALLDITPNAVDRLNYAQFYPIVIFLKTDNKHVIKQLRHGLPKSAHKSSKKLLEQCQKLERIWSHIFSTQILLSDEESWYRKLRDAIDLQQSGAVWMSEAKPLESLSDDFLFPMTTSRLSYASSPESDLELSPGPSTSLSLGNLPQLVKSSSDPSIATNQDNLDRDRDTIGDGLPPPYTTPYDHAMNLPTNRRQTMDTNKYGTYVSNVGVVADPSTPSTRPQSIYGIHAPDLPPRIDRQSKPGPGELMVPPIAAVPATVAATAASSSLTRTNNNNTGSSGGTLGRTAQERLFGKAILSDEVQAEYISRNTAVSGGAVGGGADSMERHHHASLERQARLNAAISNTSVNKATIMPQQQNGNSYDSVSSYDSYNNATSQLTVQNLGRLGPNAPDDLKSVPNANRPLPPVGMSSQPPEYGRSTHDHRSFSGPNDLNRQSSPARPTYHEGGNSARNIDTRNGQLQRPSNLGIDSSSRKSMVETKTDYGKYSRNNSVGQADYNKLPKNPHLPANAATNGNSNNTSAGGSINNNGNGPFKPVPPPKPKNYRPPLQGSSSSGGGGGGGGPWESGDSSSPRSPNGFFYPNTHHQHYAQQTPGSPGRGGVNNNMNNNNMHSTYGNNSNYIQQPQYPPPPVNGYVGTHHYNGGSGTGPYIAPHRGITAPLGNIPPHAPAERNPLDLAGSREQRGSAFELYRKPQIGAAGHHHNMREMEPYEAERYDDCYPMPPHRPPPPPQSQQHYGINHRIPPPAPPSSSSSSHPDADYYANSNYPMQHNDYYNKMPPPQSHTRQQYYEDSNLMPPPAPPLPPHKVKKKSVLKSPLVAIKNAFIKSTRPLRRMNSMVEPERMPKKSSLKRQHSMLEHGMQRPYYPDEYPTYPAGFEGRYYPQGGRNMMMPRGEREREQQYYMQQQQQQRERYYKDAGGNNSTYQNLETEDIYGYMGNVPRARRAEYYADEDLYANRAFIDLERRQAEAMAAANRGGRKIFRRHSTTTADRQQQQQQQQEGRRLPSNRLTGAYEPDDVYETYSAESYAPHGALQRRAPNSEVMARRRFDAASDDIVVEPLYQSRRELQREIHRNHLYQSKKEMQERINRSKQTMEQATTCSSQASTPSERGGDDRSNSSDRSDSIYQSRRDVKESALKTRAQLREQIYQTRREALDSMAEPIYVSRKKESNAANRPEPIYETKEENIMQSRENETDEKKEEKTEFTVVEINRSEGTLSRSDLQKSSDTVIENTVIAAQAQNKAPLVQSEDVDDDLEGGEDYESAAGEGDGDDDDGDAANKATAQNSAGVQALNQATRELSDDVFEALNIAEAASSTPTTTSTLTNNIVQGPPIEAIEPPKPTLKSMSSRVSRSPFHISNILKRTAPPPPPANAAAAAAAAGGMTDSRTSLETQYTSHGSLPVGPPKAHSTPYPSNMSLPMAGPVPTGIPPTTTTITNKPPGATASNATSPTAGAFPAIPREPTTTRGIFDSNGGTLADNIWNVSLIIPPGAIAAGVRQEIYFTVSDPRLGETVGRPPLDMENGETMLSPLVMCGPQGLEFLVPVTLNIPHCAGRTASLGLALKATDSEKNLHTEWDNIDLPSNAAAHTVSVKVDHF